MSSPSTSSGGSLHIEFAHLLRATESLRRIPEFLAGFHRDFERSGRNSPITGAASARKFRSARRTLSVNHCSDRIVKPLTFNRIGAPGNASLSFSVTVLRKSSARTLPGASPWTDPR